MSVVRHARWAALFLVLLVATSCGGKNATDPTEPARVTLSVTNDNWSDINVFVVRNGARFRLGTVTTAMERQFVLPRQVTIGSVNVRLVADPIGSRRTYTSPPLMVTPGEHVVWRVANQLSLSTLTIQRGPDF